VREASSAGTRELALAILKQAVKDMRGKGSPTQKERVHAVVFLGSNQASLWLDQTGLEHKSMLITLGWMNHAQTLLNDSRTKLAEPQRRVLQQGVNALTKN